MSIPSSSSAALAAATLSFNRTGPQSRSDTATSPRASTIHRTSSATSLACPNNHRWSNSGLSTPRSSSPNKIPHRRPAPPTRPESSQFLAANLAFSRASTPSSVMSDTQAEDVLPSRGTVRDRTKLFLESGGGAERRSPPPAHKISPEGSRPGSPRAGNGGVDAAPAEDIKSLKNLFEAGRKDNAPPLLAPKPRTVNNAVTAAVLATRAGSPEKKPVNNAVTAAVLASKVGSPEKKDDGRRSESESGGTVGRKILPPPVVKRRGSAGSLKQKPETVREKKPVLQAMTSGKKNEEDQAQGSIVDSATVKKPLAPPPRKVVKDVQELMGEDTAPIQKPQPPPPRKISNTITGVKEESLMMTVQKPQPPPPRKTVQPVEEEEQEEKPTEKTRPPAPAPRKSSPALQAANIISVTSPQLPRKPVRQLLPPPDLSENSTSPVPTKLAPSEPPLPPRQTPSSSAASSKSPPTPAKLKPVRQLLPPPTTTATSSSTPPKPPLNSTPTPPLPRRTPVGSSALSTAPRPIARDSTGDSLIAATLAPSRTITPGPRKLPPPSAPPPRRSQVQHQHSGSPPKHLPHTLRDPGKDRRRGVSPPPKTPSGKKGHKHSEASNPKYQLVVSSRQRRRYEGVWAANRGMLLEGNIEQGVHGYVVREIWRRSRLEQRVLAGIWELVDRGGKGWLRREEWVVGMWLVDGALRGRKIPVGGEGKGVGEGVWRSAGGRALG